MPTSDVDTLATYATRAAIGACCQRLKALGWTSADVLAESGSDALADRVREAVAEELPAAVADYQDAAAVGMADVARATFAASLALAGIRAADRHHDATRGAAVADAELTSWAPALAALDG